MTVLSAQTIRSLSILNPTVERQQHAPSGCSFGLSACGYDIRLDEDVTLHPGQFILSSTIEHFTMPNDVVGVVHDKSTWIRRGLCVFNTVIEPGWRGILTLELKNVNPDVRVHRIPLGGDIYGEQIQHLSEPTLRMERGTPIAQVIFYRLDQVTEQPYEGKYQDQERGPVAARSGEGHR